MHIAFASDYGLQDEFVGVCKAVMLGLAPGTEIIDLGHDIPAHDVRAGSLLLVRSVQYLPDDTVLVAVVDPGVGTDRRLVAVEVAGGFLLGPDNGLLAPATAMVGGPRRVVSLENPDHQLEAPGPTFAGRDVLAPAAAHLVRGLPLDELGPEIDPAGMVPGIVSLPDVDDDGAVAGEVWWVDRFGNCQLNVDPDALAMLGARPGDRVEVRLADRARAGAVGAHLRRREGVGARDAGRLLRPAVARARPRVGRGGARPAGGQRGHPRRRPGGAAHRPAAARLPGGGPVRPGTTIALAVLLRAHLRRRAPAVRPARRAPEPNRHRAPGAWPRERLGSERPRSRVREQRASRGCRVPAAGADGLGAGWEASWARVSP